jgi:HSP20 family protein
VKEEHEKSYLHRERSYRAFHRRITLPEEVLADKAKAKMDKGILEIELPKKEPKPKEEGVRIEVK